MAHSTTNSLEHDNNKRSNEREIGKGGYDPNRTDPIDRLFKDDFGARSA